MRIAVTGHKGRLGSELVRQGCIPFAYDEDTEFDITAVNRLYYALLFGSNRFTPVVDVVINCAAVTDVNSCETDEGYKKALSVNYYGLKNLRDNFDGHIIHISTDYVFDGKKGPYSERDPYSIPINAYGLTKQAAEMLLTAYDAPYTIARTTCLFGSKSKNDLAWNILDTIGTENVFESTLVQGNPTYIPFLAEALIRLAEMEDKPKIVHLAGSDVISRYEFALMLATEFGLDKSLIVPTHKSILGSAKRPAHAGLKVDLAKKLGLPIYTALEGVQQFFKDAYEGEL